MINNVKIVIAEEPRFSTSRSTASRFNKTVPKIFCDNKNLLDYNPNKNPLDY